MAAERGPSEAIDPELLALQTLGDRGLEADLFELFDAQAARLWPVIAGGADRGARAEAAHTLRGGAGAISATEVMRLAGALEAVFGGDGEEPSQLLASLATALTDVRSAIASWRRSN